MEEEKKEEKNPKHGGIQNYFYGPVGQYIEHVEHNHFGMNGDGSMQFGDMNSEKAQAKLFPDLPTKEEMQRAVMETYKQGYWWSSRSWAVVYRVWQLKGCMKSISVFVREVADWPTRTGFECTYDAVQKPIAKGLMVGPIEKWEANGANKQNVILANALILEIEKIREKETDK